MPPNYFSCFSLSHGCAISGVGSLLQSLILHLSAFTWCSCTDTMGQHCRYPPPKHTHTRPYLTNMLLFYALTLYLQHGVCCGCLWPSHAAPRADQSEPGSPAKPERPVAEADGCRETQKKRQRTVMSVIFNGIQRQTLRASED